MSQDIKLPEPKQTGGCPLYEALSKRKTIREYESTPLTMQQISNLLWCADGVTRRDGRRTAPSARNCQGIDIYVLTEKGTYLYEPQKHSLIMQIPKDLRRMACTRNAFATKAPVILLFVANYDRMTKMDDASREFYGATDAGYISQNVYLYCAAENLGTVVMGAIDRDNLAKLLSIHGKVILAQAVAFPVKHD